MVIKKTLNEYNKRMKKLFLFSIFILNIISCSFASELSFQKIKDNLSKQTNFSFSKNVNENVLGDSESQIYNDIKITTCERKFSDKETDCDGWYNSNDMYNLYNKIMRKEKISYGFGSDFKITKINTYYVLDYVVLSMFDIEDVRFERFIILFDDKKSIIFKLEYPNTFDSIKNEMKKLNYLDSVTEKETEYYFWNENINKSQIVKELRAKNFNCINLQNIFNKMEIIKESIISSIKK